MLEARELCRSYSGRQVLQPVSFSIGPGECLGVTGANGSGKSTLLRIIAQADRPDRGQVLFNGRDVRGDREFVRRRLGYVPQEDALEEELTVGRQLRLWQAACGLRGPLPEEAVGLLGLGPLEGTAVRALSGGQKKRLSIAMALLAGPEVLVMDEATAGLDEAYSGALLAYLEGFLARGGTLVWCSHQPQEAERLRARRLRLVEGKPVWE